MNHFPDHLSNDLFWIEAEITAHRAAGARYRLLTLRAPQVAAALRPGQFVLLRPPPAGDLLLSRPMAVYGTGSDGVLEVLYMVVGRGTRALAGLGEGARLGLLGPLGNAWTAVEGVDAHVAAAGGTGLAALRAFFRRLPEARRVFLVGARDAGAHVDDALLGLGASVRRSTDDGSLGFRGTAVQLLERVLDGELAGRRVALYAAGPVPMLAAAARVARVRGLPCRVSMEARMACGVGACRACVVDGRTLHPRTGLRRRTVCQDGPVFDAEELDWSVIEG